MKFVLLSIVKQTNKQKSTEIFPPILHKPPYICMRRARAMLRATKWSGKGSNFKEDDSTLPL